MKTSLYLVFLLSFVFSPLIGEDNYEETVKAEWLEYITLALQKKNKFNLPIDKVLHSVENQITTKYGSFEEFDKGYKKRSPKYLFGFVKILHKAKKDFLEKQWEAKNEKVN